MDELELVLTGGRVLDPASGRDEITDLGISGGKITAIGRGLRGRAAADCAGLVVLPGLIDIHCHFREPGGDEAETIASGLASAVAGGFTSVAVMPNTSPAIDTPERVRFQIDRADEAKLARLHVVAAATVGRLGRQVTDMSELASAGAVGFSDDGDTIADREVMAQVLAAAERAGRRVLVHAIDPGLASGGVMRAGPTADALGVQGIPDEAEDRIVDRDIDLLRRAGGQLHVQHLATSGCVDLVRAARAEGLAVTAEVTPHHLALCDADVARHGTNAKMAPPLSTAASREALVEALADGTLEVIASDHAPHPAARKSCALADAANGIIGLETNLPVLLEVLVAQRGIPLARVVAAMTCNPARLLGLPGGDLSIGGPADVTVLDADAEVVVDASTFRSRSRNTPFDGWRGRGRVHAVYVAGRRV